MGRTVIGKKDIQPEWAAAAADFEFEMAEMGTTAGAGDSVADYGEGTPMAEAPTEIPETRKEVEGEVPSKPDDYVTKLLKYIPVEVIALYITLEALVRSSGGTQQPELQLYWFIFAFGIVVTPLYLWRIQKVHKVSQLSISTAAFLVWVFAMGGPHFNELGWYESIYGAMLLPIYTFLIPIIEA
jgi:hypothetical protein